MDLEEKEDKKEKWMRRRGRRKRSLVRNGLEGEEDKKKKRVGRKRSGKDGLPARKGGDGMDCHRGEWLIGSLDEENVVSRPWKVWPIYS